MAVELPRTPGIRTARPRLISFGGEMLPVLGGPMQVFDRMGDRYALDVELPPLSEADGTARIYLARLRRAKREGALFAFPQHGLAIGTPGAPVVDGSGGGGYTLPLRGLTPFYALREGQFGSLTHNGRRYLHSIDAPAIADASGEVTVTLGEMLRVVPSDGDSFELGDVMIEGLILGSELPWDILTEPYQTVQFTITEAE